MKMLETHRLPPRAVWLYHRWRSSFSFKFIHLRKMLLYFRYRQLALECSPDSTSAPQVFRTCVVALVARATRRGAARRRTDDQGRQTLVVEGDVLAIDWQPWPRSRQGSGMQIHGRDCGLRRRSAFIVDGCSSSIILMSTYDRSTSPVIESPC